MFISKKKNNSLIKKLPIIKSILSDEMNNECFDCGSLNPEFISINNSIFLCKTCSYLHKKFPIEISRIIPNNLYKLEEKELFYLYYGGNRKLSEFIYLNPKLSKYKSDMLYKMNEMRYYRYNLSNIVNEKLEINKNIENYNYMKNNYNNTSNFNTLNLNRKYNRRKILFINESDKFENIINDSSLARLTTTNKMPKTYKKRYIPGSDIGDQDNNRMSIHNRKPAILFDMDYNHDIQSNSNKSNSNLVWFNNSNDEGEHKIKSYGHLDRTNFNYKNYINNTININNSNNNNFYFNQSESDIDNRPNIRNSANNSYISYYNKKQFETSKKNKIQNNINKSFKISTYKVYFKPKLPKCDINLKKDKKNLKSLNFLILDNYYTMQNIDNIKNNALFQNKEISNRNNNQKIDNIRKKYNQIKFKIDQENKLKSKLNDLNYFSDEASKNKISKKLFQNYNSNNLNSNECNISNNNENNENIINNSEDSEKVQNLSIIELEQNNINSNDNEKKREEKKIKKYNKKYEERRNLEKNERKKMEFEEKRRKEELNKIKEEKKEKKNSNRKKMTKKERLKLIEEERLAMQQEEIKTKKKKAFENKIIKEEDEEYEQEIETPKVTNIDKEVPELEGNKEKKEEVKEIKNENNNKNKKSDIVDTFKNSIRNRYKRKKNKK